MEFPELGKHCSKDSCHKLDFLPMKCDACYQIYCSEHFSYAHHSCASAQKKNVQVPVCPLCGEPVPTAPNVSPDITVSAHIDKFCQSDSKKIFTNRCTYKNCKKKELIPVQCSMCKNNFCLKHRHTTDHHCEGNVLNRHLSAQAAEHRRNPIFKTSVNQTNNHALNVQGDISEDEALARALAMSIMELDEAAERNRRNQQRSITVGGSSRASGTSDATKDKCAIS